MAFKTIVVHCDAAAASDQRATVAADLAQGVGSRLIGLHIRPSFSPPAYFDGSFVMDELFDIYQKTTASDQEKAAAAFAAAVSGREIDAEFRVLDGPVDRLVVTRARCADLVIMGRTNAGTPTSTPLDLPETVALGAGRPVLVVPPNTIKSPIGRRILLCWNGSREAARAATDAMPLLVAAQKVTVLSFLSPDGNEEAAGAKDAAEWLERHGVRPTVFEERAGREDIGSLILSRAADLDADVIVMGIYGHTRVREMVLGGASRTLLRSSTVPIFMTH